MFSLSTGSSFHVCFARWESVRRSGRAAGPGWSDWSLDRARTSAFTKTQAKMKILAVLYDGGAHASDPRLLGCAQQGLGLGPWLKSLGHTYVVTSDKDAPGCEFERELVDTDILISTPFHPAYLTAARMATAKQLKICVTAGVGSDHIDLPAANARGIGVYEVTGSNVTSVAEHAIMTILDLVRNYTFAHEMVRSGGWDVAAVAIDEWDLMGKTVGTLGCGRIGYKLLQRLKPFDCKELLYSQRHALPKELEDAVGARHVSVEELFATCDVVSVNVPLTPETRGMINKSLLDKAKKGIFIVNTARGAIMNREDLVAAVNSGQVAGYGGDTWDQQPAPKDHPWRTMKHNAMTPHVSGTSLDAQIRYVAGTKRILERFFAGEKQEPQDVIAEAGRIVSKAYM
ncbi:putative glyoxylate/hydroxypyruvate reductase [Hyaloraphidium curvatum]|nr:putative glyoxylate/hydroxypyruvate reductase [Hyaloraphidium curvatum]